MVRAGTEGGFTVSIERVSIEAGLRVHFVGIGGAGMGAIASILLDKGYRVSGSDVAAHEYTARLAARGADVYLGHDAAHVAGADMVVYSTALAEDNVELVAAREERIPVLHRSEMLARLMQEGRGIAIAGAHGKTTTTSMVAWILDRAGLDPTFVVGGVVSNLDTGARAGAGAFVVAEADESDGSFLNYRPHIAIVTNVEADHLEHYGGQFDNLLEAYERFVELIVPEGLLVTCADDPYASRLQGCARSRVVTYALRADGADYSARIREADDNGSQSDVFFRGGLLGQLQLVIPGSHNVQNALAAIAVAVEAGVDFERAVAALKDFRGALRRYQILFDEDVRVVDDYAHHPTEIAATIRAAKSSGRRVLAVFQPQRYTRTFHLFDEFTRAFGEADDVVIADIYSPAGEKPIVGVSAERLAALIRMNSNSSARFFQTQDDVLSYLKQNAKPGDIVLTMGAGDIWKVGRAFALWRTSRA